MTSPGHPDDLATRAHQDGIHHLVTATLIKHGRRSLLVETTPTAPKEPPSWGLPQGSVHVGENLHEAVARMLHEDLGLQSTDPSFIGHHDKTMDGHRVRIFTFAIALPDPGLICRTARRRHCWFNPADIIPISDIVAILGRDTTQAQSMKRPALGHSGG